jgi:hypothetical protein
VRFAAKHAQPKGLFFRRVTRGHPSGDFRDGRVSGLSRWGRRAFHRKAKASIQPVTPSWVLCRSHMKPFG